MVQCIVRRIQGLRSTQLELTTVALTSVNVISTFLWWEKPLGARTLVRVYLRKPLPREIRLEFIRTKMLVAHIHGIQDFHNPQSDHIAILLFRVFISGRVQHRF